MGLVVKNLEKPDDTLVLPNGSVESRTVVIEGVEVSRTVFRPGWRWSNDIRPIAQTVSCEYPHTGVVLEGALEVEMDDGTHVVLNPGDVASIPPGHDAWVVGDVPCVFLDWTTDPGWGKPSG
jgi:hypothetical protein